MEITLLDKLFLALTAVTAIYLIYRFWEFKPKGYLWYTLSFTVLIVAGALMLFGGFDVLGQKWVKVVATLIPFGIAIGLIVQYYYDYRWYWIIVLLLGFVLIALNVYGVIGGKIWYPIFHSIAGLTIFFVPIFANSKKGAPGAVLWVTVGGALIGIGGIALAFLGAGKPLLGIFTAEVIFTILTPLLLLMTLSYTWGFVKTMKLTEA